MEGGFLETANSVGLEEVFEAPAQFCERRTNVRKDINVGPASLDTKASLGARPEVVDKGAS